MNKYIDDDNLRNLIDRLSYFIYLFISLSFSSLLFLKISKDYIRRISLSLMLLTFILSRSISEDISNNGIKMIFIIFVIALMLSKLFRK
jgi:hypothetical protein